MSKRLSMYVASFDYFDKSLIPLSATSGEIFIASFATVIGAPEGMASPSFSSAFSITTGIVKKLLKTAPHRKKKHNKIVMLAMRKLDTIESKISEVLMNNKIFREGSMTIANEVKSYRELKESIRMMKIEISHTKKNMI